MMEEWRDIKGYEGIYQVSSYGRVRSLTHTARTGKTYKGRILKPIEKIGYLNVNLSDGKRHTYKARIHRLVAEAFIPNPNHYDVVNHIDENKHNNVPSNLEWCTNSYNVKYGNAIPRRVASRTHAVISYDANFNVVAKYSSAIVASMAVGCKPQSIRTACTGHTKTIRGYIWRFAE